jgi:hypothetical protein
METFFPDEANDLCMRMGIALAVWQNVEEQHYHVFLALLDVPDDDISSVVYFCVESFEARRKMVGRMAQGALTTADQKKEWGEIEKQLKDQNENRNKIAHYGIHYDVYARELSDGETEVKVMLPSLQPSLSNRVSVLLGRTSDKPAHNLSAAAIDDLIRDFNKLARRVEKFKNGLPPRNASRSPYRMPPILTPEISPPPPLSSSRTP